MSLETDLAGRVAAAAMPAGRAEFGRWIFAALAAAALAGLWFLRRPYKGVWHDALIYMGRGLADLDPTGVGTDISFRYDGQSSFSVFSRIVDALISALGFGDAAFALSLAALALWLVALAALAGALAPGRQRWAILICVAAGGGGYGGFGLLNYAESFATPRPFAEAFVVAALAALLKGATRRAIFLVAVAALFHPIMALPGAGIVYLHLCLEDRRWVYAGALGGLAALAAALLGAPLFSRLARKFDWNWLAVLRLHTTYLFPLRWPERSWAPIGVQAVTLGYAALLTQGRVRRLFAIVLALSLACLGVTILFGDLWPLVLVVQVQPWRALWLLTLFSIVALCFIVPALLAEGAAGLAGLALFALAWIGADMSQSVFVCALAVAVTRLRGVISDKIMRVLAYVLGAIALLAALADIGVQGYSLYLSWRNAPAGAFNLPEALGSSVLLRAPVMALALLWVNSALRFPRPAQVAVAAVAPLLAFAAWASPGDPFAKLVAANAHPPELERIVARHEGEVLWVGQNMAPAWSLLGRGSWASGGGVVFSRDFAMNWRDRMIPLVENGWMDRRVFAIWLLRGAPENPLPDLSRDKIERICARADAPAWIIGAVKSGAALPPDVEAQLWRGPPQYVRHEVDGEKVWESLQDFAVIDCALYKTP